MTTIQPRTAVVTIYQGDYLDRIQHLERKAEALEDSAGPQRAGEVSEYTKIREEHDALVAEAEQTAVHVKVGQIGRKVFRELRDKFPPRDGNEDDEALGVNEDDFFEEFVPLSLLEPEFSTRAEAQAWTESLSPVDWARVKMTAWYLNVAVGADPKALPTSRPTQDFDAI